MFRNPAAKVQHESANALILVTIFVVVLFGFAALSLDVGNVLREQRKANIATDAAALTAVALLTNSPAPDPATVQQTAIDMAEGNGVTSAEIAAGARNGFPGQVQVGMWVNGQFLPNQQTNGYYNAVRVPARRTVPLSFAKVLGPATMNPAVDSVAALLSAGRVDNAVPFGVSLSELTNKTFGDSMTLNDNSIGSGKQGKLDIGNYQNTPAWQADMTTNGCNCIFSVGTIPVITGNAQVRQAFQALGKGAVFVMPVADQFDTTGNKPANILGFVLVQITDFGMQGANWYATVTFLRQAVGTAGGGFCPPPCVQARVLVE
jgi:Flp pilus assembly protein TadG